MNEGHSFGRPNVLGILGDLQETVNDAFAALYLLHFAILKNKIIRQQTFQSYLTKISKDVLTTLNSSGLVQSTLSITIVQNVLDNLQEYHRPILCC